MFWRLRHMLFGSHFVHLENSASDMVRKVRVTVNGERYVVWVGAVLVFLDRPNGWTITPLTWREPPKAEIRRVA